VSDYLDINPFNPFAVIVYYIGLVAVQRQCVMTKTISVTLLRYICQASVIGLRLALLEFNSGGARPTFTRISILSFVV